ncbi:MAG: hypothetical protein IPK35_17015 [Saprospiraceae bacterium]|jgi:hypothetical protein|nr:hypothetical protein [Saprospiraceae bacterium]
MKTFKDKILNHKNLPDPMIWEKMEPQVILLNNQEHDSGGKGFLRLFPKTFSILLFLVIVLGIYGLVNQNTTDDLAQNDIKSKRNSQNIIAKNLPSIHDTKTIDMPSDAVSRSSGSEIQTREYDGNSIAVRDEEDTSLSLTNASTTGSTSFKIRANDIEHAGHDHQILSSLENSKIDQKSDIAFNTSYEDKIEPAEKTISSAPATDNMVQDDSGISAENAQKIANETRQSMISIPSLTNNRIEHIESLYDSKKQITPCKPCAKTHFFEIGTSMGPSQNHYYNGYFANLMFDYKVNKLLHAGVRFSYQRYVDHARYITAPDVKNKDIYINLLANVSLILVDYKKINVGIDFMPGIQLVSDIERTQNSTDFFQSTRQYFGFNYMIGANMDYKITSGLRLGFESVVDVKGETTLHGIRIKFLL